VNQPAELAKVLQKLEAIQKEFNTGGNKISLADLIVLAGSAAVGNRIFKRYRTSQERDLKRLPAEPAEGRSTQVRADSARSLGVCRLGAGELAGL
jgi:hypothetical protein